MFLLPNLAISPFGLLNNNTLMILPIFLKQIKPKPGIDRPMITALNPHIRILNNLQAKSILLNIFLDHISLPKQNSIAIAGIATFLQRVLTGGLL